MCGILGFYSSRLPDEILNVGLDLMLPRGPDGEGRFKEGPLRMGMRRLSIIDISGGDQPFVSQDGRWIVFQNGEIYNYIELRKEFSALGYSFKSRSDTEVILAAVELLGPDNAFNRLDGMFGISVYDSVEKKLYLARDKYGEKPLYYYYNNEEFFYCSDLRWVAAQLDCPSLDKFGVYQYLTTHFISGPESVVAGVKRVEPGSYLQVSLENMVLERSRYYEFVPTEARLGSVERAQALVEESIRTRVRADVPVGVFLSGGIDSSLIAALSSRVNPDVTAYSIAFPSSERHNEAGAASVVADFLRIEHVVFDFDVNEFRELIPRVAAALDEPIGDQAMLPTYVLCREAAKDCKVVLSGEAADEVFGGYGYYYSGGHLKCNRTKQIASRSSVAVGTDALLSGFPLVMSSKDARRLAGLHKEWSAWDAQLTKEWGLIPERSQAGAYVDMATWLQNDLLVKLDRMAMANSLEGRVPFLAPDVVEYGLSLGRENRLKDGMDKYLLRTMAEGLLPVSTMKRKKQGFVLPLNEWLQGHIDDAGGLAAWCGSFDWIDGEEIQRVVGCDLQSWLYRERLCFAVLMFDEWYNAFALEVGGLKSKMARVVAKAA